MTIKQIVGKGAFSQVAKAAADNLQGRTKKTLVAIKMLLGTKKYWNPLYLMVFGQT